MPGAMSLCLSFASALSGFERGGRKRAILQFRDRGPVDQHLPGNGLALGAVHELHGGRRCE